MKYIAYTVNTDCANISCDEFINLMIDGFNKAVEIHKSVYSPIKVEAINNAKAKRIQALHDGYEKIKAKWMAYANTKWLTEKRRNKYIEDETKKYFTINNKCYNTDWDYSYDSPTFFDMDLEPWTNSIHSVCIIGNKDLNKEFLTRTYEAVKDNKYFINAKGWQFVLEISEHGWKDGFRPQIKLILNEETQNKFDEEKETLHRSIIDFYSNTNYFGD